MHEGDTVRYTGPHGGMSLAGRVGTITEAAADDQELPRDISDQLANAGHVFDADEDWWVVDFPVSHVGQAATQIIVPESLLAEAVEA